MSSEDFHSDGYFYFIPGMTRVYSEADLQRLVKNHVAIIDNVCRITGAMNLLLTFKASLFAAQENYVLRARNIGFFHLVLGTSLIYTATCSMFKIVRWQVNIKPLSSPEE